MTRKQHHGGKLTGEKHLWSCLQKNAVLLAWFHEQYGQDIDMWKTDQRYRFPEKHSQVESKHQGLGFSILGYGQLRVSVFCVHAVFVAHEPQAEKTASDDKDDKDESFVEPDQPLFHR